MSDCCADAAFLNMVHMYKRMLGPKVFPKGVFDWPPHEWLASYHAKKRLRGTNALVVAGSEEPATKSRRLTSKTAASSSAPSSSSSHTGASSSSTSKTSTDAKPGCQLAESVAPVLDETPESTELSLASKWGLDTAP